MSKWIYINKKLPDTDGEYICTVRCYYGNYDAVETHVVKFEYGEWQLLGIGKYVVAWMPMPKPCQNIFDN